MVLKVYPSGKNSQAITDNFQCFDPLRPYLTIEASCWCIPVWIECSDFTRATWRWWETHCICIVIPVKEWAELCTNIQGDFGHHIWSIEVSCIYLWQEVYASHRSPTPHNDSWAKERNPLCGSSLVTEVGQRVCWRQVKQKEGKDHNSKLRHFVMGRSVMVKSFCTRPTWVRGIIVQQLGPLTYMSEVSIGKFWKRHVDHVKDYPSKGLVKEVTLLLPVLQIPIQSWPVPETIPPQAKWNFHLNDTLSISIKYPQDME